MREEKMRIRVLITLAILGAGLCVITLATDKSEMVTGVIQHSSVKKCPTVVYIEEMPDLKFTPPSVNAVIDQRGKVFSPKVLAILVGTTVDFLNSDDFEHNVFSPDGEKYDLGNWGKNQKRSYTFNQPGVYTQLCRVHPEMVGYVVALKTPYFAIADELGEFTIPDIPVGTWELKVWNDRLRPKQLKTAFPITVTAGQRARIEIKF
jgi:plastocyanin